MKDFFDNAQYQDNPLRILTDFLQKESKLESSQQYDQMRFVGYVLDIGFDEATVITCDPYKKNVGGVPRGSFLIMAPEDILEGVPPHFTLLRVTGVAPTPLSKDVQQTYFELHKKSMPELDIWTKGELHWGALSSKVLGMFYPLPDDNNKIAFSGDVNNVVSAHRYKVFSPNDELLSLIVNGIVKKESQFSIGNLRLTECELPFSQKPQPKVDVTVSTNDFRGFRTAMFGKTRLGKSNVVKLIAQSIIETTKDDKSVGQLIFDINGEYANDNIQDGSLSLRSVYEEYCQVYALTKRDNTPSKPLKLNFYEQPESCIEVLKSLLQQDNRSSIYISSFANVNLPTIKSILSLPIEQRDRHIRKILIYWAILKKAGFGDDSTRLLNLKLNGPNAKQFNPGFSDKLREAAYKGLSLPDSINSLSDLVSELEVIAAFNQKNSKNPALKSTSSGEPILDPHDIAMLNFLAPSSGAGPTVLTPYAKLYHSPTASNFIAEITQELDEGKTVILDLGNATDEIRRYFSDMLSKAVFSHQEKKFVNNKLKKDRDYVQLYFEEAHNLFPREDKDVTGVYARFAKEGAKFHIGMVYSTQSPSTINKELLAQTENFFVAHMSSQDEANALAKLQVAFDGLQQDILKTRTPGYLRMLTFSYRFIVPLQAYKFGPKKSEK